MTSHPSLLPDMNDSLLHPQLHPVVLQQQSLRFGTKRSDLTDQSYCGAKSPPPPTPSLPEAGEVFGQLQIDFKAAVLQ